MLSPVDEIERLLVAAAAALSAEDLTTQRSRWLSPGSLSPATSPLTSSLPAVASGPARETRRNEFWIPETPSKLSPMRSATQVESKGLIESSDLAGIASPIPSTAASGPSEEVLRRELRPPKCIPSEDGGKEQVQPAPEQQVQKHPLPKDVWSSTAPIEAFKATAAVLSPAIEPNSLQVATLEPNLAGPGPPNKKAEQRRAELEAPSRHSSAKKGSPIRTPALRERRTGTLTSILETAGSRDDDMPSRVAFATGKALDVGVLDAATNEQNAIGETADVGMARRKTMSAEWANTKKSPNRSICSRIFHQICLCFSRTNEITAENV